MTDCKGRNKLTQQIDNAQLTNLNARFAGGILPLQSGST